MAEGGGQIPSSSFLKVGTLNCDSYGEFHNNKEKGYSPRTLQIPGRREELAHLAENFGLDLVLIQEHYLDKQGRFAISNDWLQHDWVIRTSYCVGVLFRSKIEKLVTVTTINGRTMRVDLKTENENLTFFCVYAPSYSEDGEKSKKFFSNLEEHVRKMEKGNLTIVMGDFNAPLDSVSHPPYELKKNDNTPLLESFLRNLEMVPIHERYATDPKDFIIDEVEQLITFEGSKRSKTGEKFHPFGTTRFAQYDHILIRHSERQRVSCSIPMRRSLFPSDHKLVCCQIWPAKPAAAPANLKSFTKDMTSALLEATSSAPAAAGISSSPAHTASGPHVLSKQQKSEGPLEQLNLLIALREYRYEFTKKAWYDIYGQENKQKIQEQQQQQQQQKLTQRQRQKQEKELQRLQEQQGQLEQQQKQHRQKQSQQRQSMLTTHTNPWPQLQPLQGNENLSKLLKIEDLLDKTVSLDYFKYQIQVMKEKEEEMKTEFSKMFT